MSEYEERFRDPLPSLGETFAASRVRKRSRWQRHRIRVVAAAVGVACAIASFDGKFRYDQATTVGEQISSTTVSDRVEALFSERRLQIMLSHLSVAQCQFGLFNKLRSKSNIVPEPADRGVVIVGSPNSETSNGRVGFGQAGGLIRRGCLAPGFPTSTKLSRRGVMDIEPSLDELFGDDAIQLLMRRDGVTESEVRTLLVKVREALTRASHKSAVDGPVLASMTS